MQYASIFGKHNSGPRTGKCQFYSNPREAQCQRMFNLLHNFTHSQTSKVLLKILQARIQHYINRELPDIQAGFRKGRGNKHQNANIHWIIKKATELQKNIYFCFLVYAKSSDCVDHNKLWKTLQEMGIQITLPAP